MGTTSILTVLWAVSFIGNSAWAKNMALETNDINDQIVSTNINFIFDLLLKCYTRKIVEENKTQIAIDDFEWKFSTRIFFMDLEAAIIASDGWAKDLSSIQRTGDAEMDITNGHTYISAHLGLRELKIDFNNYDISILEIHQKGKIHVTVGDNSLWLKLIVQMKPCLIALSDFKIEKLENIQIDITNLGIFEKLTDDISTWIANEVTKWFRKYIEVTLFQELTKAVQDADLCRYWPL